MADLVGDKTDGMGYDNNTAFPLLGIIIVLLWCSSSLIVIASHQVLSQHTMRAGGITIIALVINVIAVYHDQWLAVGFLKNVSKFDIMQEDQSSFGERSFQCYTVQLQRLATRLQYNSFAVAWRSIIVYIMTSMSTYITLKK